MATVISGLSVLMVLLRSWFIAFTRSDDGQAAGLAVHGGHIGPADTEYGLWLGKHGLFAAVLWRGSKHAGRRGKYIGGFHHPVAAKGQLCLPRFPQLRFQGLKHHPHAGFWRACGQGHKASCRAELAEVGRAR